MLSAGFHQGSATRPAPRARTSSACARKSPGRQRPGPDLRPRLGTGASAHAAPPAPASPPSAAAGVLLPLADVPSGRPVPSEGSSGEPARGRRRGAGVLSEPSPPPLSGDCACGGMDGSDHAAMALLRHAPGSSWHPMAMPRAHEPASPRPLHPHPFSLQRHLQPCGVRLNACSLSKGCRAATPSAQATSARNTGSAPHARRQAQTPERSPSGARTAALEPPPPPPPAVPAAASPPASPEGVAPAAPLACTWLVRRAAAGAGPAAGRLSPLLSDGKPPPPEAPESTAARAGAHGAFACSLGSGHARL